MEDEEDSGKETDVLSLRELLRRLNHRTRTRGDSVADIERLTLPSIYHGQGEKQ